MRRFIDTHQVLCSVVLLMILAGTWYGGMIWMDDPIPSTFTYDTKPDQLFRCHREDFYYQVLRSCEQDHDCALNQADRDFAREHEEHCQ